MKKQDLNKSIEKKLRLSLNVFFSFLVRIYIAYSAEVSYLAPRQNSLNHRKKNVEKDEERKKIDQLGVQWKKKRNPTNEPTKDKEER